MHARPALRKNLDLLVFIPEGRGIKGIVYTGRVKEPVGVDIASSVRKSGVTSSTQAMNTAGTKDSLSSTTPKPGKLQRDDVRCLQAESAGWLTLGGVQTLMGEIKQQTSSWRWRLKMHSKDSRYVHGRDNAGSE